MLWKCLLGCPYINVSIHNMMKNLIVLFILLLIFLSLNNLQAQQLVTYSGPVEYYLEVSKKAAGKGTDGGFNWNVSIDDKRIIKGSFFVFFSGNAIGGGDMSMYQLTSIEEDIEFNHRSNNEGNDQKSMGKDMPDSERSRSYIFVSSRSSPEKPVITSGFMVIQKGKYRFILSGEMDISSSYEYSTVETYPLNRPPTSVSETTNIKLPVVISGEKNSKNLKYLEGTSELKNEQSSDCRKCMDGNLASLVHGDMECSYISKITTSWTLVKRSDDCNAEITYLAGDVKINGVPAKKGTLKVGAGDVIETGEKSRVTLSIKDKNELYNLGSKSKLQLTDPCKPDIYNPPPKGLTSVRFLAGRLFSLSCPGSYTRNDFDSDEEWQRFQSRHTNWFRYGGAGVRGWILKAPDVYFASVNLDINHLFNPPSDSEKEKLIPALNSIPKDASAFYIHCKNGEVKDFTVVKGTLKIEDSVKLKNKIVPEGTTINIWDDGSKMTDIIVFSQ